LKKYLLINYTGLYRKVLSEGDNSSLDEAIEAGVVTGRILTYFKKLNFLIAE
jgi:hypothetical protein